MRSQRTALAASCWIASGVVYLVAETIAAAAYPGYSYAGNYISDLGVPGESPAHVAMNAGFVLHGVLLATAALLTARELPHHEGLVAIAVVAGTGNVLVGLVHSGQATAVGALHGVGAALAIVGGNLTAIVAGLSMRKQAELRGLGMACLGLGVAGLLSALALVVDGGSHSIDLLADGTWERLAVYTITAFEILLGTALFRRRR